MDGPRFDRWTQHLGRALSRRRVGGLLAAALGGAVLDAGAKGKGKGKNKGRANRKPRGKAASPVTAQAVDCFSLGPGSNVSGCDYEGEDHSGEDLSGSTMVGTSFSNGTLIDTRLSSSNLRNARFTGAKMCGANLRSSTLRNADFRGADLTNADLSSSGCAGIRFNAATVFCGTKTCTGSVRNDDCPGGLPVGYCCSTAGCGPGQECRSSVCCATDPAVAIAAAAPGTTVRICAGTYRVVDVLIDKNLTVIGAGAGVTILDAQKAGRVMEVGNFTVEVRNLTVTGGKVPVNDSGGGIRNFGNLTLIGVTVRKNEAPIGGGIRNAGSAELTLGNGALIEENTATVSDGGVSNGGTMTMRNGSRVINNTTSGDGGGIFNTVFGVLTLQAGSRVENNTAGGSGGGIRNFSSVTIDPGAVVTGNSPDNCEPTIGTCS
jgi:hypothetical protein